MDAIVLAGGVLQPHDPLYGRAPGLAKALLPLGGRPMVQWIIDALNQADSIDRIVVAGLAGPKGLESAKRTVCMPDRGSLIENLRGAAQEQCAQRKDQRFAMMVSADIPLITGQMIDWICASSRDDRFGFTLQLISRATMERRFPQSKRQYFHFRDGDVCMADTHAGMIAASVRIDALWDRLIAARKSVLRLAALFGPYLLLRSILYPLTLGQAVAIVAKRVGIRGRAMLCPYVEAGMDVDKPFQADLAEHELLQRGR